MRKGEEGGETREGGLRQTECVCFAFSMLVSCLCPAAVLSCFMLYCTILYLVVLFYTALFCIVLYRTASYRTVHPYTYLSTTPALVPTRLKPKLSQANQTHPTPPPRRLTLQTLSLEASVFLCATTLRCPRRTRGRRLASDPPRWPSC